jgi:hypothetical protein
MAFESSADPGVGEGRSGRDSLGWKSISVIM